MVSLQVRLHSCVTFCLRRCWSTSTVGTSAATQSLHNGRMLLQQCIGAVTFATFSVDSASDLQKKSGTLDTLEVRLSALDAEFQRKWPCLWDLGRRLLQIRVTACATERNWAKWRWVYRDNRSTLALKRVWRILCQPSDCSTARCAVYYLHHKRGSIAVALQCLMTLSPKTMPRSAVSASCHRH